MDSGRLPEVPTRFFELDLVIESDIGNCQVLLTIFIMRKLIINSSKAITRRRHFEMQNYSKRNNFFEKKDSYTLNLGQEPLRFQVTGLPLD